MQKTLLFLVNPKAGKAEIRHSLLDIIDQFVRADWRVVVRTTQYAGELTDILQQDGHLYDLVVCSGGDGTLNEAVGGLLQCSGRPTLGYIPSGTTNDFATSLGIPRTAMEAVDVILNGEPFPCDVGLFNQRHFVYVAAFGAFTEVSYSTPQQFKNALGRAAYILEGIRHLPDIKTYKMTLEHDNQRISGEFVFGMVSNSTSIGGFKMNNYLDVSMNDGLLEVLFVRKLRNPVDLQNVISALLLNDFSHECIISFHARELRIYADEEIPWTLDGEYGGDLRNVQIQVQQKAYDIMAPGHESGDQPALSGDDLQQPEG